MKINSNEKGITLVALVVTIIVLLILAGVSLSLVLGDNGIITRTQDAVNKNDEATAREQVAMAWAGVVTDGLATGEIEAENVNKYLSDSADVDYDNETGQGTVIYDGYIFDVDKDGTVELSGQMEEGEALFTQAAKNGQVKIGDYVDYTPDTTESVGVLTLTSSNLNIDTLSNKTYQSQQSVNGYGEQTIEQENLNWRVFSINKETGEVLLISETPTKRALALQGSIGWLHAEEELNNICRELYSGSKGRARHLTVEDVNQAVGYTPTLSEASTSSDIYYPDMNGSETYTNGSTNIDHLSKGKYTRSSEMTSYGYTISDYSDEIRKILIGTTGTWYYETSDQKNKKTTEGYASWLASRGVDVNSSNAYFYVRLVNSHWSYSLGYARGYVDYNCNNLFYANTTSANVGSAFSSLRPVVSLKSSVLVDKDDLSGEHNSENAAWRLK